MGAEKKEQNSKRKRRIRNLLLKPSIQMRLGIYAFFTASIFSILTMLLVNYHLGQFAELLVELTDLEDLVQKEFIAYIQGAIPSFLVLVILFFLMNLVVAILHTHRLIGPSYAFRRHLHKLLNGDFSSRVVLRKNDAFEEVATDLNQLAEWLQGSGIKVSESEKSPPEKDED